MCTQLLVVERQNVNCSVLFTHKRAELHLKKGGRIGANKGNVFTGSKCQLAREKSKNLKYIAQNLKPLHAYTHPHTPTHTNICLHTVHLIQLHMFLSTDLSTEPEYSLYMEVNTQKSLCCDQAACIRECNVTKTKCSENTWYTDSTSQID